MSKIQRKAAKNAKQRKEPPSLSVAFLCVLSGVALEGLYAMAQYSCAFPAIFALKTARILRFGLLILAF
jgi:hypothetical protein